MNLQKFTGAGKHQIGRKTILISRLGKFWISSEASKFINGFTHCVFYHDAEEQIIGLKFTNEVLPYSNLIGIRGKSGNREIAATYFLKSIGYDYSTSVKFEAHETEIDGGPGFYIDLKEPLA